MIETVDRKTIYPPDPLYQRVISLKGKIELKFFEIQNAEPLMGLVRANHQKVNYHSVLHLKFAHGMATGSVCYSNILYTPISDNH